MLQPIASASTVLHARFLPFLGGLTRRLLVPKPTAYEAVAGTKHRAYLKLRCQFCYFTQIDGRRAVQCHKEKKHRILEKFDDNFRRYDMRLLWN